MSQEPATPHAPGVGFEESLRPHLMGVAYRMMGVWSDAEDVVQSAWLRAATAPASRAIEHPRAWWTRVIVRACLDERSRAHRRREAYVGPWLAQPLPEATFEPLWEAASSALERESLQVAMLTLLQSLSPLALGAYMLRDLFEQDYDAIAACLDLKPAAARQLVSRARARLAQASPQDSPRVMIDPQEHEQLLGAFMRAAGSGDLEQLRALLRARCVARADGGGVVSAALRDIVGAAPVARYLLGLSATRAASIEQVQAQRLNGQLALVLWGAQGGCQGSVQLVIERGQIAQVLIVRHPKKLALLSRDPALDPG